MRFVIVKVNQKSYSLLDYLKLIKREDLYHSVRARIYREYKDITDSAITVTHKDPILQPKYKKPKPIKILRVYQEYDEEGEIKVNVTLSSFCTHDSEFEKIRINTRDMEFSCDRGKTWKRIEEANARRIIRHKNPPRRNCNIGADCDNCETVSRTPLLP